MEMQQHQANMMTQASLNTLEVNMRKEKEQELIDLQQQIQFEE